MTYENAIQQAANALTPLGSPSAAVILGSGLSEVLKLEDPHVLPFNEIPGFPRTTVAGHAGKVEVGKLGRATVLVQRGRVHYYEGHAMTDLVLPIRAYARLGVRQLLITNASGGISPGLAAGDLVLISDHINMMGDNPLRGPNLEALGPRFPDMTYVYEPELRAVARAAGEHLGITLKEGVYVATMGPSYETPAEIKAFRALGADLVGMSTVPEAIAARHAGLRILGISCVTNLAAGVSGEPLSHEEVVETTQRKAAELGKLLEHILQALD